MLRFISYSILRFPERFPGARPGYFRFRRFYMQAPFWSYISHLPFRLSDSSRASKVFYQVYAKNFLGDVSSSHAREFFDRANSDVQRYQTNPRMPNFNATWGMKVTWVRLYPITYPLITAVSTLNDNCQINPFSCIRPCDHFNLVIALLTVSLIEAQWIERPPGI